MDQLLSNPKFKKFIDAFNGICKAAESLSLDEERRLSTEFFLSEAVYEPIYRIEDIEIQGRGRIPLRIYTPHDDRPRPVIVYFHRGGWVFGSIEDADPVCRKLANHLDCVIVSTGYSLAPENPFPRPLDDCYDATLWTAKHFKEEIMVCGESAGGNLAAAVALLAKSEKQFSLSAQVLIYPAISSEIPEAHFENCPDKYFLTQDAMKFFKSMYLQTPEDEKNIYASPNLASDFQGLPPALIVTAEYDPLREDGENYAKCLKKGGVPVIMKCFPKVIHGFIDLPIYEEGEKISWIKEIGALLKGLR